MIHGAVKILKKRFRRPHLTCYPLAIERPILSELTRVVYNPVKTLSAISDLVGKQIRWGKANQNKGSHVDGLCGPTHPQKCGSH